MLPAIMALDLTIGQILLISLAVMLALLMVAYGIAGWYERKARSRRERPKKAEPGPTPLAPFDILQAVGLSILTFSIYFWILVYRNSRDIHGSDAGGFRHWRWLFWGGLLIPVIGAIAGSSIAYFIGGPAILGFAFRWAVSMVAGIVSGLLLIALYVINWIHFRAWAKARQAADETLLILALVLVIVVPVAGEIVWAINWNTTLDRLRERSPSTATTRDALAA